MKIGSFVSPADKALLLHRLIPQMALQEERLSEVERVLGG